ncbi:MAG: hypothetical protein ACI9SP_000887 [Arenicella sp.]|jgi:hypothetical protein
MNMLETRQEIYSIEDTPSWVKEYAIPKVEQPTDSPFSFPLVDYQDCINDDEICSYRGTYQCVNDESRIEDASLHLIELHQGSQRLLIHELSIVRDGKKIDALDSENISAIQRERSLESHITDNRITVSISIDDLRVGDHVLFRSTVIETQNDHPFHGRHFSTNYSLSWSCPVALQVVRVINSSSTQLSVLHKPLNSKSNQHDAEVIEPNSEFEREYTDLPNERIPDSVPHSVWGSFLQVSSTLKWGELSQYLYQYFVENGALTPLPLSDIEDLEIYLQEDTLDDKALKIIRFVQNNIRYRGENHGVFTHTPKPPQRTLKKRAGDCKDKSNLMVAMLTSIGINARLVLVNTSYGKKLREFNPSPYHFNHMIVDVEFENKHYFVDATIQKQAGSFQYSAELDYGMGLILTDDGCEPVDILKSPSNRVFELKHRFTLPRNNADATLEIERVYYLHRANNMRSYFSSNEKSKYQQDFLEWAKGDTRLSLELIEPVEVVDDDHVINKLTTKERYRIVDLATSHADKPIELLTDFASEFLRPDSDDYPIRIDLDGEVQHDIFVVYDRRPDMQLTKEKLSSEGFEYMDIVENIKGNELHYLTRVTPLKDQVDSGDEAKNYKKNVERIILRSNNLIAHKNKAALAVVYENQFYWYIGLVVVFLVIKALVS